MSLKIELSEDAAEELVLAQLKENAASFEDWGSSEAGRNFVPDWERLLNAARTMIEYYSVPPQ